jgi:hypothetical protein
MLQALGPQESTLLIFEPGSYVTHTKLSELGSGELIASENGRVRIRFASGERDFVWKLVSAHLTATDVAPVLPATKAASKGGRPARKTATAKS